MTALGVRVYFGIMAATIPTYEPESFVQGETVDWTKYLADYVPDDGWELTYALVLAGSTTSQKTITASNEGDGKHTVEITDTESAAYTAGVWHWQAKVSDGTTVKHIGTGRLTVEPSFADAASGLDDRSHAKKMVDTYRTLVEAKAAKDVVGYTTPDGVSLSKASHAELREELAYWERMYAQEKAQERIDLGFGNPRKVRTRRMGRR